MSDFINVIFSRVEIALFMTLDSTGAIGFVWELLRFHQVA